jgi:Reverse transcriptase (RNA-dependent DNA polymerase)
LAKWPEPTAAVYATGDALEWALAHVESVGDTVFLPRAFEYAAIRHDWPNVQAWLTSQDLRKWKPRPSRRFLASKSRYSFRYVTQLDPLEYLVFTALLLEIGPQLESIRVPKSRNTVFSWRFELKPNGQMYDPAYRWHDFNTRCLELAERPSSKWVVVADIADFFPHIYSHPVEQALERATQRSPSAYCVLRMISNWNAFVSYGLPVGLAGSRILAEATIDDLDRALDGAKYRYCRYSDDIRIFCRSEGEARRALEFLAIHLFENHGLTLQPMKTVVVSKHEYMDRFTSSGERVEAESVTGKLQDLLEEAGWEDEYEDDIENYEDLPDEIKEEVDKLNLVHVLEEQVALDRSDPVVMSFILQRLRQLGIDDAAGIVLKNLAKLYPVIDSVVRYLESLRSVSEAMRNKTGAKAIAAVLRPTTGTYERVCLLSLFTKSREFDNEERFEHLYEQIQDAATRRELMLALGQAHQVHWFQTRRRSITELEPWSRRAFLAAFSCVPKDARVPFYRSLRTGGDVLEGAIIKWASDNPF